MDARVLMHSCTSLLLDRFVCVSNIAATVCSFRHAAAVNRLELLYVVAVPKYEVRVTVLEVLRKIFWHEKDEDGRVNYIPRTSTIFTLLVTLTLWLKQQCRNGQGRSLRTGCSTKYVVSFGWAWSATLYLPSTFLCCSVLWKNAPRPRACARNGGEGGRDRACSHLRKYTLFNYICWR